MYIPSPSYTLPPLEGIHTAPCKLCPSTKGSDPETEQIKTWPKPERLSSCFRCAWRTNKLCRGYIDSMALTADDFDASLLRTL